eukprot:scaffold47965_cov32-Phaeocystis_antarctica.AAC.1
MSRSTSCSHVPPSSCCCRQGRGLRRWRVVLPLAASCARDSAVRLKPRAEDGGNEMVTSH